MQFAKIIQKAREANVGVLNLGGMNDEWRAHLAENNIKLIDVRTGSIEGDIKLINQLQVEATLHGELYAAPGMHPSDAYIGIIGEREGIDDITFRDYGGVEEAMRNELKCLDERADLIRKRLSGAKKKAQC